MKISHILYTTLAVLVVGAAGCKKETFQINANPNDITDVSVSPTVLLPGAQQFTSKIVDADWPWLQMWMGYWARSGSYQSLTDIETYKFSNGFPTATAGPSAASPTVIGNTWTDLYYNTTNYNLMMVKAQQSGAGFYEAIGRIMKAHNYQILVDLYNNVPYFEAFKGTAIATPKYDAGQAIYQDLFRQLDTAIAILKTPEAIEESKNSEITISDLVYQGNETKWIQFANTLRLRLLVHLHNGMTAGGSAVPGFDIQAEVAKITDEGFIGTTSSAHLNPGFSATKPNPFYRAYVADETGAQRGDIYRANQWGLEYYRFNYGDPRMTKFYLPNSNDEYKGIPFGQAAGIAMLPDGKDPFSSDSLSSVAGEGILPEGAASRAWIMTSVESLFLQAEALERGIITTSLTNGLSAKDVLTEAVRESFTWLGLTTAEADTYMSDNATYPDVDYDAAGGGMFTIMSQKWFALNVIAPFEVWTDYRRTDYVLGAPVDYPGPGLPGGPPLSVDPNAVRKIPVRLLYPQSEYNYNAANVGTQGSIDLFNNRIFWDAN